MPVLHDAPGETCRITIRESDSVRYLELDGCEEGAMDLKSEAPVFNYLWFHKCSCFVKRPAQRILVLGAGAFTAAKCLALDYPDATVDVVDVEPHLEAIAQKFFRLSRPEYARIVFHGMPAEKFLAESSQSYDFLFDDLFDGFQHVPRAERSQKHFRQLRRLLAQGGVCVKNVIWNPLSADTRAACEESLAALRSAFPSHAVLALGDRALGHNQMLVGMTAPPSWDWPEATARLVAAGMPKIIAEEIRVTSQ